MPGLSVGIDVVFTDHALGREDALRAIAPPGHYWVPDHRAIWSSFNAGSHCRGVYHNNTRLLFWSQSRVKAYNDCAYVKQSITAESGIISLVYSVRFRCLRSAINRTTVLGSTPRVVGNV